MCHGIVREAALKFGEVYVFAKPEYFDSVSFMYRDNPNIKCISADDQGAVNYVIQNKVQNHYARIEWRDRSRGLERGFYEQVGLSFEKKFANFYVKRDSEREKTFFDRFNLEPYTYAFVHDDVQRNMIINKDHIRDESLKIFQTQYGHSTNIFDNALLVEYAKEVHVIESCFMFMTDLLIKNDKQDLFIHRYCKPMPVLEEPNNQRNWNIITAR